MRILTSGLLVLTALALTVPAVAQVDSQRLALTVNDRAAALTVAPGEVVTVATRNAMDVPLLVGTFVSMATPEREFDRFNAAALFHGIVPVGDVGSMSFMLPPGIPSELYAMQSIARTLDGHFVVSNVVLVKVRHP